MNFLTLLITFSKYVRITKNGKNGGGCLFLNMIPPISIVHEYLICFYKMTSNIEKLEATQVTVCENCFHFLPISHQCLFHHLFLPILINLHLNRLYCVIYWLYFNRCKGTFDVLLQPI